MAAFAVPSEVVQATVTADDAACDRPTVKVTALPSAADAAATETVAVSSSVIVTLAASTVRPLPSGVVPVTATVSLPSTIASSVGSSEKVAVPLFEPATMVSVKSVTAAKSVPEVAVPLPTETVTAVAAVSATPPSRVPVTVMVAASDAFSATSVGATARVTLVGAASSSVMVPVAEAAVPDRLTPAGRLPPDGTARVTVKVSAPSTRLSSVVLTWMVVLVAPAVMVALPSLTAV